MRLGYTHVLRMKVERLSEMSQRLFEQLLSLTMDGLAFKYQQPHCWVYMGESKNKTHNYDILFGLAKAIEDQEHFLRLSIARFAIDLDFIADVTAELRIYSETSYNDISLKWVGSKGIGFRRHESVYYRYQNLI